MNPDEIRELGEKHYFENRGKYENPYELGSAEYNEYEHGWSQALRRDRAQHMPSRPNHIAPETAVPNENPVNRYALAKGRLSGPRKPPK